MKFTQEGLPWLHVHIFNPMENMPIWGHLLVHVLWWVHVQETGCIVWFVTVYSRHDFQCCFLILKWWLISLCKTDQLLMLFNILGWSWEWKSYSDFLKGWTVKQFYMASDHTVCMVKADIAIFQRHIQNHHGMSEITAFKFQVFTNSFMSNLKSVNQNVEGHLVPLTDQQWFIIGIISS